MSCPMMSSRFDPIADELLDKSLKLYPNHTIYTHLGCVLLRTVMGLLLINPSLSPMVRNILIGIIVLSLVVFGYKYLSKNVMNDVVYWKAYPRMLVAYSSALCLISMKQEKLAGLLIIADGLMGINSRHTASVLSCGIKKNKT